MLSGTIKIPTEMTKYGFRQNINPEIRNEILLGFVLRLKENSRRLQAMPKKENSSAICVDLLYQHFNFRSGTDRGT